MTCGRASVCVPEGPGAAAQHRASGAAAAPSPLPGHPIVPPAPPLSPPPLRVPSLPLPVPVPSAAGGGQGRCLVIFQCARQGGVARATGPVRRCLLRRLG